MVKQPNANPKRNLDQQIQKSEREIRALEKTLAHLFAKNAGYKKTFTPVDENSAAYEQKSLLEEQGWRVNLAGTLDGRGGHCIVRGEQRVILKSQLPTPDKIDILVEALRGLDLDGVHLRPDLRELIEPGSLAESEAEEQPAAEPAAGS